MKMRIIILSIALVFVAILGGCKKSEETQKTGKVSFSGLYFGINGTTTYNVAINGKTGSCNFSNSTPACETISNEVVSFSLPVGTYTFEFTRHFVAKDGHITDYPYTGTNSVTITDGGCVSVRWK